MFYMKPFLLVKWLRLMNKLKMTPRPLRLGGIDTGKSYTGVALTNFAFDDSSAFQTCHIKWNKKPEHLAKYIANVVQKNDVGGLVIGYSAIKDYERELPHQKEVFGWIHAVRNYGVLRELPFTLADEWDSSNEADNRLRGQVFPSPLIYERMRNRTAANCFTKRWLGQINEGLLHPDSNTELQNYLDYLGAYLDSASDVDLHNYLVELGDYLKLGGGGHS